MAKLLQMADYRTAKQVARRYERAMDARAGDMGIEYLAYAYTTPGANPVLAGSPMDAKSRHTADMGRRGAIAAEISRIYNSQLSMSAQRLRDRVMAELFPDGSEWAHLEPGDSYDPKTAPSPSEAQERTDDKEAVKLMLEPIQRVLFQDLHRSNFSEQTPEAVLDAIIWRVGVLRTRRLETGEGNSSMAVQHVSQAECGFEWGADGSCWGLYRSHYVTREEAEYLWPDGSGWQFEESEAADDPDLAMVELIEAAYRVPRKKAWAYQVIQRDGNRSEGINCVQREYKRNPYVVFGFASAPGARLARSLVEQALPTARSLNALARITLQTGEFQAQPIFLINQSLAPNVANKKLRPGIQVPVQSNDRNNPAIARLDVGGNVDIGWASEERLALQIQKALFDEDLPDQAQPKTAYEISQIMRRLKNTLGPIFSRLMNQLGQQVLQHFLDALYDLREIKGMNREGGAVSVIELDGREVKLSFQNPLAQAQRLTDLQDVIGAIRELQSVMPPELVAATIGFDELPAYAQKQLSLPKWFAKSEQARGPLVQQATSTLLAGPGTGQGPQTAVPQGASMLGEVPEFKQAA